MYLSVDTVLVLISTALVLLMHAGFVLVEVGFNREKNALNITMKNMLVISLGPVLFYLVSFGLSFGDSLYGLVGTSGFLLNNIDMGLTIPLTAFFAFQAVFAATGATIVSGAVAERIKFSAFALFSIFLLIAIYPVVTHWIWGGGWLTELGFVDFAGSTVVHSLGGWAALVGAAVLGPRIGKYVDGKVNAIPGHNIPLGALGVIILWFGWFGFNTGSALSAEDSSLIGSVFTVTLLGASAGVVATMLITALKYKKPDVSMSLNGALIGLVSITAGAAALSPLGAIIVGAIAGTVLPFAVEFFDRIKVDDPVGAITVHGVGGMIGTIAVGLFAVDGGLFYGGGTHLLLIQTIGVAAVFAYVMIASFIAFKVIEKTIGLRVSDKEEKAGLDISEHGSYAYSNLFHSDHLKVMQE